MVIITDEVPGHWLDLTSRLALGHVLFPHRAGQSQVELDGAIEPERPGGSTRLAQLGSGIGGFTRDSTSSRGPTHTHQ